MEHIYAAICNVEAFTKGFEFDALKADKLHYHAAIHNVQVIGEAVYKLTPEFKDSHPETPWQMIEKMRHILVHDYYQIEFEIFWDIIKKDLPILKEQIGQYLHAL